MLLFSSIQLIFLNTNFRHELHELKTVFQKFFLAKHRRAYRGTTKVKCSLIEIVIDSKYNYLQNTTFFKTKFMLQTLVEIYCNTTILSYFLIFRIQEHNSFTLKLLLSDLKYEILSHIHFNSPPEKRSKSLLLKNIK